MTMSPLPADTDLDLKSDADDELDASVHSGIQSVEVGSRLLEVLTYTTGPMIPRDLARVTPMSPARAHHYLVSFARLGLVTQTSEGRYGLGPFALEMGLVSLNRQDPIRRARPAAAALRDEIDHTVDLAAWGNWDPTVVHREETSHPVTANLHLGDVMPILNSIIGCVFGVCLPRAQTRSFIQRELDRIAAQGESTDPEDPELSRTFEAYDVICADVRLRGVSRIHGGVLPGINAISLPVFDTNDQLCPMLIVLGTQNTFDIVWSNPLGRRLWLTAQ